MRTLLLFVSSFLLMHMASASWKLAPVSSTRKLTASAPGKLDPFLPTPVVLRAAKGEWESFQFVVSAGEKPIEKIEIQPNGLASSNGNFLSSNALSFWRENFAYVARPSGNQILIPKWWPDALIPLNLSSRRVETNQDAVFWATIRVPTDLPSGQYYGELDVLADGVPRRLALTLDVENRLLPAPRFRGMVALYYESLRDWYRKSGREFSELDWGSQKRRYYDFLLGYRLNAYDLPVAWEDEESAKILGDPRVVGVRTPPLNAADFEIARARLAASGTTSKAFYYWHDEPQTPEDFQKVRESGHKLRALRIKHLVTAHPSAVLDGAVDVWCPNVGDWFGTGIISAKNLEIERKKGHEIWSYTMAQPRFPFPTWLLDDDGEAIRSYANFWRQHKMNGFVYSMVHGWGPQPLESLESFAQTNGDGTLLYPAELVGGVGPMPSIRLMQLRDAMEDWELNRAFSSQRLWPAVLPVPRQIALGKAQIDGALGEWDNRDEQPFKNDKRADFPSTRWFLRRDEHTLYVGFRVQRPAHADWAALEIWSENGDEKWRFIGMPNRLVKVQKFTREGRTELKIAGFHSKIKLFPDFYNLEFAVPIRELPRTFRVGALRRALITPTETRIVLSSD